MTDEIFEYLKKFEWLWDITVNAKYNRRVPTNELQELARIYKELSKDKNPLNLNCNTCVFTFERRLGMLYFEEQKKREKQTTTTKKPTTKHKRSYKRKT